MGKDVYNTEIIVDEMIHSGFTSKQMGHRCGMSWSLFELDKGHVGDPYAVIFTFYMLEILPNKILKNKSGILCVF